VPASVKLLKYARRRSGACSSVVELALACSPPAKKPCRSRSSTSRIGAATPIAAYVGRQSMKKVALPIPTILGEIRRHFRERA